ncbi:hypothetical protein GVAV_000352 [Gurleya vavrai]
MLFFYLLNLTFSFTESLNRKNYPKTSLSQLRDKILKEYGPLDNENDDIEKSKILGHRCGMINTEGICYFNAVIQSLFANKKLLLFYIMNDFSELQVLSKIIQKLAYQMLISNRIDPVPFLEAFSKHPRLVNHCTVNGGNPLVLVEELLRGL